MFRFIKDKFSKFLTPQSGSENNNNGMPPMLDGSKPKDMDSGPKGLWRKDYKPLRQLVLWGWDDNNNPSFLILYGRHDFKSDKGKYKLLSDDITYTCYAVFKGMEGHLPSSKAVKIIEDSDDNTVKMYYKKGLSYYWGWSGNENYIVREFKNLEPQQYITFPYFRAQSYEHYIQKIEGQNIVFEGFRPSANPNEILKLDEGHKEFLSLITCMLSHHSIYTRKMCLVELLSLNPPKELLIKLLNIGSTELISGLFMELARTSNPVLAEEAKVLLQSEIKWANVNYGEGVKRCIRLYLNAVDPALREGRIKWIHNSLSGMDLHLTGINGREFSPDRILDGSDYRDYALSGLLRDSYSQYDYNARQYKTGEAPKRFNPGPYTDGVKLRLIDFKNTIQESDIYGLSDVIGKIAYYLDAPRLTYYLKGSSKIKALKYFHRYVRRVMDSYAQNNPEKFIEAMKVLLTSYTKYDFICKFDGNFQFNAFIKYYLYNDFKEKPPEGWNNWYARFKWNSNDQLMKLEGRHEFRKDIWDSHLDAAADIAVNASIPQVVKAFYYILKDSPNASGFIQNIQYKQLINLALVSFEPLSLMFMKILTDRLNSLNTFDPELMLALIGCPEVKMHQYAMEFFKRTNGVFSAEDAADLLLLENLDQWAELFSQNLNSINEEQYEEFIKCILKGEFLKLDTVLPQSVKDALSFSVEKIKSFSRDQKIELMSELISALNGQKLPEWLGVFVEEAIFSFSYEELESLLGEASIEKSKSAPRITSILKSIGSHRLPSDSEIINILDSGTSKMIKMLFEIITRNKEELSGRFSTLLIMFESAVTILNTTAEEVFDSLPAKEQQKLHAMLIDSPVKKACLLGLKKLNNLYNDLIPEEFIIHMLEHGSIDVKTYISDKIDKVINDLNMENKELFMYYVKTVLLLPNRASKSKKRVYEAIPRFAVMHKEKLTEIEDILLNIGGSNIILDSEQALVALASIRKEVVLLEG